MDLHVFLLLLLAGGSCAAASGQTLSCALGPHDQSLERVWCRQSSGDCCVGLAFSGGAREADGGRLKVTQTPDSFTVLVQELSQGEGTYWCGVLGGNRSIIRLAEGVFHRSASVSDVWSFARWILLPLLPMAAIFTNMYIRTATKPVVQSSEDLYDDIAACRALADRQDAAAASEH